MRLWYWKLLEAKLIYDSQFTYDEEKLCKLLTAQPNNNLCLLSL